MHHQELRKYRGLDPENAVKGERRKSWVGDNLLGYE